VSARVTRSVTSKMVGGLSFADVPTGECRRPVDFEASQTTLAEMFDEVFGGETKNSGNRREVVCVWLLEVPSEAQHIMVKPYVLHVFKSRISSQSIVERSQQVENIRRAIMQVDEETAI